MTTKILWYQNSCEILDEESTDIIQGLDRHLSFLIQGAEHSKAFKGYVNARGEEVTWDGRKHLLKCPGLRFAPGLLDRVKRFYEAKGAPLEVVDCRAAVEPGKSLDIYPRLTEMGKTPYPYQIEAAEIATKTCQGIIKLPTGSGKTILAAMITAKLGKRTIIYVIGKDLLYQLHDLFQSVFQQPIGMIGDGKCEIHDINIATIWSVGRALGMSAKITLDDEDEKEKKIDPAKFRQIKQMLLDTKLHLADECQLAACDTVQTIAQHIKPEYVYGMSASPCRDDNADLLIESFLGSKIVDISARTLISQGYLVPPIIRFLAPPRFPQTKKPYQTIYKNYIVENNDRNEIINKGAIRLVEQGYKPLVLFRSLNHGEILYELISKNIPCVLLSGKDKVKERRGARDDLESGKIKCIIASNIFDQGVDIPCLSGLVAASSGKSSVRALQRIGRVIRKHPGKKQAAVIDFADQVPYLYNHALARKEIYETEFDVSWPKEKT